MGLFSRKKKSAPSSIRSAPSPSSSFSTICPSPPASPGVAYYPSQPFFDPIIALRVAVDPASHDGDASVFTIVVDHEAGIERIRGAIAEMIGTTSTSLFKVSPSAYHQLTSGHNPPTGSRPSCRLSQTILDPGQPPYRIPCFQPGRPSTASCEPWITLVNARRVELARQRLVSRLDTGRLHFHPSPHLGELFV